MLLLGRQHGCLRRAGGRGRGPCHAVARPWRPRSSAAPALGHPAAGAAATRRRPSRLVAAAAAVPPDDVGEEDEAEYEESEGDGGFEEPEPALERPAAGGGELGAGALMPAAAAAAAAGGGDEGEEEQGEIEDEEPPFPEPEPRAMYLSDLLGMAAEVEAAQLLQEHYGDVFVTGITDDPEAVLPGDLFCCVERLGPGGPADGHEPVALQAALAAGAVAVLAEAGRELPAEVTESDVPVLYASDTDELSGRLAAVYYDAPSSALSVVAVTGTSGKTTVSWLVRGVLEQAGELTGMVGSIEHALAEHLLTPDGQLWEPREADPAAGRECSSPFTLVPYRGRYRVEEATPNGLQMQKLLASMRDRGATSAVVECSAPGIASGATDWLQPSIVVFTGLGDDPASLELFGSKQEYLDAQLALLARLKDPDSQRAVVNADNEAAAAAVAACGGLPVVTYGINSPAADVRVESLELTLWQTTMIVATPVGRLEIITNLVGRHNVYNVLAAVAVGVLLNVPLADIGAGIESVQVVPGRCEVVNALLDLAPPEGEDGQAAPPPAKLPTDFPVVVDAADSPARLAAVLESLREAGAGRVFTVFGCDGVTTSGEARARMGEVAHQRSEFVILTNASPGLEEPADIIRDIVAGWPPQLFEPYAAYVYDVFTDQTRAPLWFEPFLHSAQRRWKRHIMEDRFQAIRAAIGTAAPGDVVLLAGRGHKDWVAHADGAGGGLLTGWFDDRVEARNALSKLEYLYSLVSLDRSALPWGPAPDEGKTVVVEIE